APATSIIRKNTSTRIRLVRTFRLANRNPSSITSTLSRVDPNTGGTFGASPDLRLLRRSGHCAVDQRHFLAGHEFFDVDQDQHALAERADAGQVFRGEGRAEAGRGADLRGL